MYVIATAGGYHACTRQAADAGWAEGHIWIGHAAVRGIHADASAAGTGDVWTALEHYSRAAAAGVAEVLPTASV